MEIGIVGLPNVGKSTLFNALARAAAPASNYPYCTIEPNVAVVHVRDERLANLRDIVHPDKITDPVLKFVDIAGLARGASKGEGLGNLFLSHIRGVDAIAHVVRCFRDASVVHVEGETDPLRDIDIIETELLLADVEMLDRRTAKMEKVAKGGDHHLRHQLDFLARIRADLDVGKRFVLPDDLDPDLDTVLKESPLLTSKPMLIVANVDEELDSDQTRACMAAVASAAEARGTICIPVSAKLECEAVELPAEEAREILSGMGFEGDALQRFVRACYDLLKVITFFTIKGEETRGWTLREGTSVRDAAGKIHSDMRDRFICAEVVAFEDFISCSGMAVAREKGLVRTEGKDYIVRDGDIVLIRFGK
jgi:GTP-binding protein YchF